MASVLALALAATATGDGGSAATGSPDEGAVQVDYVDEAETRFVRISNSKWPNYDLTWSIVNRPSAPAASTVDSLLQAAISKWDNASALSFTKVADCGAPWGSANCTVPDIRIRFANLDGPGGHLGEAFPAPGAPGVNAGNAGDVTLDSSDDWTRTGFLPTIAAHEVGHGLGLGHTQESNCGSPEALMCSFLNLTGEPTNGRALTQDDINGIKAIYPDKPSFTLTVTKGGAGTGTITSSPAGISCPGACVKGFTQGTKVTLTAAAASGSKFTGFTGGCTSNGNQCSVSMNAAKSVTASFAAGPRFAITNVAVDEGGAGTTTNATFTVSKTGPAEAASVNFATANDTAVAPSDYTATSGKLSFGANDTNKSIAVTVKGDAIFEAAESFFVNLSAPSSNAAINDDQGVGTIRNDDAAPPTLSINNVTVAEGNEGTTLATFTVTKAGRAEASSVSFATANDTATSPSDFSATSGRIEFAPADTSKTVSVPVNGDDFFEANETFVVNLTNPTNALLGDAQGAATITNDDARPKIAVNDVTQAETKNAFLLFEVTLDKPSLDEVTVFVSSRDGTALVNKDYLFTLNPSLSFAPGETSRTVAVAIVDDKKREKAEFMTLELSSPSNNAEIVDPSGTGTIPKNRR